MGYASQAGGLWLTRSVGEEIIIGEGENEVVIVVEAASGGRTQLRLLAGPHITIQRAELRWSTTDDQEKGGRQ